MPWATTADVLALTGQTVTDAQLLPADTDITVYANRSPEASAGMSNRDLYWLKLATVYQTVWRASQPSVDTRQMVSSISTDGTSVTYRAEWNVVLSPMAARSLRNLSWKATRTVRTPRVEYPRGLGDLAAWESLEGDANVIIDTFLEEDHDPTTAWQQPLIGSSGSGGDDSPEG